MFKDILVVFGENDARASSYAVSFARQFNAHVTAACATPTPVLIDFAQGETCFDFALERQAEVDTKAVGQLRDFVTTARELSVRAHAILPDDADWSDADDLPVFARNFDLTIAAQPEPKDFTARRQINAMLTRSGRPLLLVPYVQSDPANFRNVIVAWDGSRSAARALADALPILKKAVSVEIVTVAIEMDTKISQQSANVVRHLAAYGIKASFMTIASQIDVGNVLLSHIADMEGSLLVMGGFGHSPLREAAIGGVTRTVLESATVPVFMSH
jgi:nucleotide-binding universal stress UspA family protein